MRQAAFGQFDLELVLALRPGVAQSRLRGLAEARLKVDYEGTKLRRPKPIRVGDCSWLIRAAKSESVDVEGLEHEIKTRPAPPSHVDPGLTLVWLALRPALRLTGDAEDKRNAALRDQFNACRLRMGMTVPGRVWALDFAEPSQRGSLTTLPPVDGVFTYLLAVRDLASGYILAWLPLPEMTAELLLPILRQLFRRHGPPPVLKWDNGSAFRAEAIKHFLEETGVIPLYSPPQWPRYNGAIEAGIGSLKTRTDLRAARQGNLGGWTSDDLAAAVFEANTVVRYRANSPADAWTARTPIDSSERVSFQLSTERHRFIERREQKLDMQEHLDHWRYSALDRNAVRRALVEHGYLLFGRRRIPLIVRGKKTTRFV